jgi:hypothetical protein
MRHRRLRLPIRAAIILALDATAVGFGGWLLWSTGGTTVVSGTIAARIEVVCGVALLFAARSATLRFDRPDVAARITIERIVLIAHTLLLAGLITAWHVSDLYFIGWLSTYAALMLLVACALQLLVDLTSGRNFGRESRRTPVLVRRLIALETGRIIVGLAAAAGIALTAPVHAWNSQIINVVMVLSALSIGLATVTLVSISAWTSRPRLALDDNPSPLSQSGRNDT